jgi:hypothetical protein
MNSGEERNLYPRYRLSVAARNLRPGIVEAFSKFRDEGAGDQFSVYEGVSKSFRTES